MGEPQSHHNLGSVLRHLVVPLGLDSTCFLLRLRFLRALDDRVFLRRIQQLVRSRQDENLDEWTLALVLHDRFDGSG